MIFRGFGRLVARTSSWWLLVRGRVEKMSTTSSEECCWCDQTAISKCIAYASLSWEVQS